MQIWYHCLVDADAWPLGNRSITFQGMKLAEWVPSCTSKGTLWFPSRSTSQYSVKQLCICSAMAWTCRLEIDVHHCAFIHTVRTKRQKAFNQRFGWLWSNHSTTISLFWIALPARHPMTFQKTLALRNGMATVRCTSSTLFLMVPDLSSNCNLELRNILMVQSSPKYSMLYPSYAKRSWNPSLVCYRQVNCQNWIT